ncbi:tRNA (adenosine(37)-N6)-dimethylallyltransferase MiaA [Lysobacteraceae bacterium NML08-0793]|nr:tRNA (adenosine(37)-N6)-dimethylallyltransferase MiaA [Xanthomonadaceae bacterium NML08-0793]
MPADTRPLAIALMGPTAAGKTATALALAERHDGEIVSVDSALVYRRLDIGSAKPSDDEQARVRHHLLDLREPWQPYSAADFAADAHSAVKDVLARGKLPILAGGTGLYFQALLRGLAPMPEASPEIRAAISARAAREGWAALHAELAAVDPLAAARIHATDPQRIQRALEIWQLTGKPISVWQAEGRRQARFPAKVLKLVLAPAKRSVLHQRIEARFDAMLAAGFLDEVRALRALPALAEHPAVRDLPAIRAVGYRQAWDYLDGATDAATFRNQGIFATRQLAKRQLTWLRSQYDALWFDPQHQHRKLDAAVAAFLPRS